MHVVRFALGKVFYSTPKPKPPPRKPLGSEERENIQLLAGDMRSFYRLIKKFEKIPEQERDPEDTAWIIERAQQLHLDYYRDRRKNGQDMIIGSRQDLAEFYEEKRDKMARSAGRHMIAYEAAAAVVTAATGGMAWAWAFGTATAAGIVEFIIRNSFILDRKHDRADKGWKKVVEYASKKPVPVPEPEARAQPAAEQNVVQRPKDKVVIGVAGTGCAD